MTATLTTWARLDWFWNSFEYMTHTGGVGDQNENQKYDMVWVWETRKPGKDTEFRRKESIHCKAEAPDINLSFFICFTSNIKSWPVIKYCHSIAIIITTIRIFHVVLSFFEVNAAFAKQMQSIYGRSPPSETILSVSVLGRELGLFFLLSAITKMI